MRETWAGAEKHEQSAEEASRERCIAAHMITSIHQKDRKENGQRNSEIIDNDDVYLRSATFGRGAGSFIIRQELSVGSLDAIW